MSDDVGGPTVSLAEAGAQSHLSVATIRRRLKSNQIPGAVRNDDRSWSIPVASLVAEGIWTGTTDADDDQDAPSAPTTDLAAELVAMRHRAELAELERDQLRLWALNVVFVGRNSAGRVCLPMVAEVCRTAVWLDV